MDHAVEKRPRRQNDRTGAYGTPIDCDTGDLTSTSKEVLALAFKDNEISLANQ